MLLDILKSNVRAPLVSLLTSLLQHKLTPSEIRKEISKAEEDKASDIVCELRPQLFELVEFRFEFSNPRFQEVAAARRLADYEWTFPGGGSTVKYERCQHYFDKDRKICRRWRKLQERQETIKLKVSPLYRAGNEAKTYEKKITVRPPPEHGGGAVGIQVFSFAVSLLIGVLAAFGAQFGTLPELDSLSSYVTPFLFGFGLDQIRDKTSIPAAPLPAKA